MFSEAPGMFRKQRIEVAGHPTSWFVS
jgi:hypothetical protein